MAVTTTVSVCLQLFTIGLLVYIMMKLNTKDDTFEDPIKAVTSFFKPIARKPVTPPTYEKEQRLPSELVELPVDVHSECEAKEFGTVTSAEPDKDSVKDSDSESDSESRDESVSETASQPNIEPMVHKKDEVRNEDETFYESETHEEEEDFNRIEEIALKSEGTNDKDADLGTID